MSVFVELFLTCLCSIAAGIAIYLTGAHLLRTQPEAAGRFTLSFSRPLADKIVAATALTFVLVFGSLSVLKYMAFQSAGTDLAQYDQLVWTSLQGNILQNTIVRDANFYLSKAFTPILLDFVPLYALWSDPAVLLVVQTLALGLGGLPIYWFARKRLGPFLAAVITIAYYLSPALEYMALDDFHEITLAVPLLTLVLYFLLNGRNKPFLLTLAVTFLVKDEIALIAAGLGIFVFLVRKARMTGLALTVAASTFFWLLFQYILPAFRGADSGTFYYLQRYGYLGNTLSEIARTVLTRPDIVLPHLLVPAKIAYLLELLVPLSLIPLVGVEVFLLTLPTLGYTLLSDVDWQFSIKTAYPAPLLPFLFFATVLGMERLLTWMRRPASGGLAKRQFSFRRIGKLALGVSLLVSSLLSYYLLAPGPLARAFASGVYSPDSETLEKYRLLHSIPRDAVVAAQNEFIAHVSDRQFVYEIPIIPNCWQADYLVYDSQQPWYGIHQSYWTECLGSGFFQPLTQLGTFVIARPRIPDHLLQVRFGRSLTLLAYTVPQLEALSGGMSVKPIILIQSNDSTWQKYSLTLQVVDVQGHVWAVEDHTPGRLARPDQLQVGKPLQDQFALNLPPTMPRGEYQITAAVHPAGDDPVEAFDSQGNSLGTEVVITTVRVEKNKASFAADQLKLEQPVLADLQELRLLGYVPPRETLKGGDLLQVGLYWRARAEPRGDYRVSVELRDTAGRVAFEHTDRPAKGTYPTTEWDAGEVLLDWHDFNLPGDILPGTYDILITLRDAQTQRPLGETKLAPIVVLP